MLKKQRKLLVCLVCSFLLLANESNVLAATIGQNGNSSIVVQSVNTAGTRLGFSISNIGIANIAAGVVGKAGTSQIQLSIKLQKYIVVVKVGN